MRSAGKCNQSPAALFSLVTGGAHRAIRASAAAGGLSFFLPAHHADHDSSHHRSQYGANDDRSNIFANPSKHFAFLLFMRKCYFLILTVFVSLADSLYGLKIIQSINASTAKATIKPMTFRFPVNADPN